MATLTEILDDRKQYPDETKITLASGAEVELKELRAGFMKDADYRKKTSEVAERRRALDQREQEVVQRQLAFEQEAAEAKAQLEALAAKVVRREPEISNNDLESELMADPRTKLLMEQSREAKAAAQKAQQAIEYIQKEREQERLGWVARQHSFVLSQLQEKHPELDAERLIGYAKSRHIPRLDDAFDLMTKHDQIEAAKEEGKRLGIEEGKKLAAQPRIPSRKQSMVGPLPENAPKTLDEAFEAAANDPQIQGLLEGQETE